MRQKEKLFEIKVYKYNNLSNKPFYRAESNGISVPTKTIKSSILKLIKDLKYFGWIENGEN